MRIPVSLLIIIACFPFSLFARQPDSLSAVPYGDTALSPFVSKVSAAAERDRNRNQSSYRSGKIRIRQQAIWDALSNAAQEVKLYLVANADVEHIPASIVSIRNSYAVIGDGIFINKGTAQTDRNLSVSSVVLSQLMIQTEGYKKRIDKYVADLTSYRNKMDSLLSDPVIYVFPRDSVSLVKYLARLRVIAAAGDPSDNALNEKLELAQQLQNGLDDLLFSMRSSSEKIEAYRDELAGINLKREFSNLWQSPRHYRPLNEILHFSFAKEKMALQFYAKENLPRIVLLIFLVGLVCMGVYSLKRKVRGNAQFELYGKKLIMRHPLASSLIVVLSIYQFVFINAPFIFSFCIWSIGIACLLVVLQGYITRFWAGFWAVLTGLFLLACLDNFLLQASRTERWFIAVLSLAGVVFGSFIIVSRHKQELKERAIILFVRFLVIMETFAFLLDLFGRYNLSKILLVAGYAGTVSAILFLWVIRLINEGLGLGTLLYRDADRSSFYINFNRVGSKAPRVLYVLLAIGWCVIVGRQFYVFRKLSSPLSNFLHKERTLGDYSFSINGLVLFILIAVCSVILSRIVSFFADDPQAIHGNTVQQSRRIAPGSWILLVRILIICLGLFLAFAAAGFPLDKLTIVLGALSVGIGLGLQSLVSNLVSGLIIAFEKPVNVGDLIEVDGKSGIMKSIGFRSSIVSLRNGAHLVVPNGDLLNNHVVNWSNARNARKIIIPLDLAYGSDLRKAKAVLEQVAGADEHILETPAPAAIPRGFGNSAIHIDLVFWVKNLRDADTITGNIILEIDQAFRENNITIPFPRQDVHLYRAHEQGDDTGA